ncbi:MAG: response regulator [Chloroflexota bacterium]|nr:response regulator [Chloroflexota bacterium]
MTRFIRILVVDDDPSIIKLLGANLKARDFDVVTAEDGESGFRAIEQTLPDLVVLDYMMPKMTGLDVVKQVRGMGNNVPIIILTARCTASEKEILIEHGVDDYMTKPFIIEDMMKRIHKVLDRKSKVHT